MLVLKIILIVERFCSRLGRLCIPPLLSSDFELSYYAPSVLS